MSPSQPEHPPQKLKGRMRLLGGFHRMSSSPSLARMGRNSASGYKNSKASVSCISLSSPSAAFGTPLTSSLSAELASGYTTNPASVPSTPGIQIPVFDDPARVRYLEKLNAAGTAAIPRSVVRLAATPGIVEEQDYFSIKAKTPKRPRFNFNFWQELPAEIRTEVLSYLTPKEVVRCSAVSKAWHKQCFDGQLWAVLDTCDFYQRIPADALVGIITSAGPFVRDLNLRGCVQLRERWHTQGLADACRNLEYFSLEGCRIDRTSIHCFLLQNPRLVHINFSGLSGLTNSGLKIIAQHCVKLEHLNVSWCNNIDTRGLRRVIEACPNLSDLRAGEIRGWDDLSFMQLLFEKNRLETLTLMSCDSLTDDSFKVLLHGRDPEIDYLNGRPIVPPRRLRHLDLSRCRNISDQGISHGVYYLDNLEGLQLQKCTGVGAASLNQLIPTLCSLTHLDVEELDQLNNQFLQTLAESPCAKYLRHLSISYCENLGDTGMLPVMKTCTALQSLEMDNTRISDLVLVEAAAMVRRRSARTTDSRALPDASLRLVAYDCQNVTWTGIREVLSRNAEVITQRRIISNPTPVPSRTTTPDSTSSSLPTKSSRSSAELTTKSTTTLPAPPTVTTETVQLVRTYPTQVIALKCFYNYQPTVQEHTKRVLRGDFGAATRLERKWAEFMVANEEAGATGAGHRRRRRRAREAQMMHADEADDGLVAGAAGGGVGGGRRRRARSGGCVVM